MAPMNKRKCIDTPTKNILAEQQYCANRPTNPAPGCKDYICPLWNGPMYGKFDESGYEIDHIVEVALGGTNDLSNLQKLCPSCHAVKTKRCAKEKWTFNSFEIDEGFAHMDIDKNCKNFKKLKRRNSQ
jgi:hypothetical protein